MTKRPNEILELLASYVLTSMRGEEICLLASRCLDNGICSDGIVDASIMEDRSAEDVGKAFEKGLTEAGIQLPSKADAAFVLARVIAKSVLAGRISPYEGARKIWWEFSHVEGADQLLVFAGLASEYEDATQDSFREEYEQMIREECEALISR